MTECRMEEWQDGGMAEWQDGGMAEWRNGGIVFYYIPNLSCNIYGTRRRRLQHRWLLNHLDVLNAVFFNGRFWLCHEKIVHAQKRTNDPFKL